MKRTNVVIDEAKIKAALKAYDLKSMREVIDLALTELLKAKQREAILDLKGKVKVEVDLNKSRGLR